MLPGTPLSAGLCYEPDLSILVVPGCLSRAEGHPGALPRAPPAHLAGVQEQALHGLSRWEDLELLNDVHPGAHVHRLVQPAITWNTDGTQAHLPTAGAPGP